MGEWNPFLLGEFEWEILKTYLRYGYGEAKLYAKPFFQCSYNDETVCMTLNEFAQRAVNQDGELWRDIEWSKLGGGDRNADNIK